MPVIKDRLGSISERSSKRMSFRTRPSIKQAIQRAAAMTGVDASVFIAGAAYKAAAKVVQAHERTVLALVDHAAFFAAMDAPPRPADRLRRAFVRHRETVTGRS